MQLTTASPKLASPKLTQAVSSSELDKVTPLAEGNIDQFAKVGRAEASNGVPANLRLHKQGSATYVHESRHDTYCEALGTAARVAAADDVVERVGDDRADGIDEGVQETEGREALSEARVVDERDNAADCRCRSGGTADPEVFATAVDPEPLALRRDIGVGL